MVLFFPIATDTINFFIPNNVIFSMVRISEIQSVNELISY